MIALVASTGVVMIASCSLFVDLSDLSNAPLGDASSTSLDGAVGDAPIGDGPLEKNDAAPTPLASHVIAIVGNVPAETGTAQQQHLVYATNTARWWFFSIVDTQPTNVNAAWSSDFTTWTNAPARPLSLSMSGEGRNFSLAYASLAGRDVVHQVNSHFVGSTEQVRHARSTISGTSITYESGVTVTTATPFDALANPDGCVTAVSSDGSVYDVTGWYNQKPTTGVDTIGREDIFQASTQDLGGAWTAAMSHDFSEPASGYVHNRSVVVSSSGAIAVFWPSAETPADTGNIMVANSIAPGSSSLVFPGGVGTAKQSMNDWNTCTVTPTDVHAVRRLLDGGSNDTFEHVRYDTASSSWVGGPAIAAEPGKYGSGVVLFSDGHQLVMLTIAADANNSIRSTKWNGTTWSSWITVVGTPAVRSYLSGNGCNATKPGIVWTEGSAAPYSAVGLDVSSLF